MVISVKNLAQIKNVDKIKINNLNIFIGKNGTGKTYFAKLIYFLNASKYKVKLFENIYKKKLRDCFDTKSEIYFSIDEQEKFLAEFQNEIKNKFPEYIGSTKEIFKRFSFDINIELKEFSISFNEDIKTFGDYIFYIGFKYIEQSFNIFQAHYLPAARANYMITYKYLFESQWSNLKDILLNKNKQKRFSILPEVENNFLEDIYNVDTKLHGTLFYLGSKIEKNIFKNGKLSIKNPKHQDLPTYEYKLNDIKANIELVSASSAVTELSPLIMYFRHKILKLDVELLIIDEPELSLHPEAQSKLVEIIVEAINNGLKIILVTHSPFILEAINNHLQKNKIKDYRLTNEIKNFESLNPDNVTAYLFEDEKIINILDSETKLIDDKLLSTFNNINNIYDKMRDIEWKNMND